MYSTGEMSYSCKENTSKNYRAYTWKFNANLFKNSVNGTHTFYRSALKRDLERTFSGYIDMGKLYIKSKMNDVVPQKQGDRIKDRMKKIIKDSHEMIYYISMLSTTGGKLKVSPKKILKNYNNIKRINI